MSLFGYKESGHIGKLVARERSLQEYLSEIRDKGLDPDEVDFLETLELIAKTTPPQNLRAALGVVKYTKLRDIENRLNDYLQVMQRKFVEKGRYPEYDKSDYVNILRRILGESK